MPRHAVMAGRGRQADDGNTDGIGIKNACEAEQGENCAPVHNQMEAHSPAGADDLVAYWLCHGLSCRLTGVTMQRVARVKRRGRRRVCDGFSPAREG
jgi:hypothetical protein